MALGRNNPLVRVVLALVLAMLFVSSVQARPRKPARVRREPVAVIELGGLDGEEVPEPPPAPPALRGKAQFADALRNYLNGEQFDGAGQPFAPPEALAQFAAALADSDWDRDGCDDFGSEFMQEHCVQLPLDLRIPLYNAVFQPPQLPTDWPTRFPLDVRDRLRANLQAREAARAVLDGQLAGIRLAILRAYVEMLNAQGEGDRYAEAMPVLRELLQRQPLARDAPQLQWLLIHAADGLASDGQSDVDALRWHNDGTHRLAPDRLAEVKARVTRLPTWREMQFAERRQFKALFAPATPWSAAWRKDAALLGKTRHELNFLELQAAQMLRAQGKSEEATAQYLQVADALTVELRADPQANDAYETTFVLAETLYWAGVRCRVKRSEQQPYGEPLPFLPSEVTPVQAACATMRRAIAVYDQVRDWPGKLPPNDADHAEEAAWSAVQAMREVLEVRIALPPGDPHRLPPSQSTWIRPTEEQDRADEEKCLEGICRVKPQPLDDDAVEWIARVDAYVLRYRHEKFPDDPERVAKLALQVAELLYKNRQFEPNPHEKRKFPRFWSARQRFWWIVREFPRSVLAQESFKDLLVSYQIEHDFDGLQETADRAGPFLAKDETERNRNLVHEFCFMIARPADTTLGRAEKARDDAEALADPEKAAAALAHARELFHRAGQLYYDLRRQVPDLSRQKAVHMNAARAFYRAEAWDEAFVVLGEIEQNVRAAKPATEQEKALNTKRLAEILDMRADLYLKFFDLRRAIDDWLAIYRSQPEFEGGRIALKQATRAALTFDDAEKLRTVRDALQARAKTMPGDELATELLAKIAKLRPTMPPFQPRLFAAAGLRHKLALAVVPNRAPMLQPDRQMH